MFGKAAASAGRSTEGSVPITNRATVMAAPVFPAVTSASALPSRTRCAATCSELPFFRRNAWEGESVMVMTSSALTISMGRSWCLWRVQLLADGGFDADKENAHAEFARGEQSRLRPRLAGHGRPPWHPEQL